jgi:hypothetical protein
MIPAFTLYAKSLRLPAGKGKSHETSRLQRDMLAATRYATKRRKKLRLYRFNSSTSISESTQTQHQKIYSRKKCLVS